METRYAKLLDGKISYAGATIRVGERMVTNPTDAMLRSAGWFPVVDEPPEAADGCEVVAAGWANDDEAGVVRRVYEQRKLPSPTVEDYDAAMEEHIAAARVARGYTTREPSAYATSGVARYKQDAADWQKFIDAVMTYALGVINTYKETGEAPSLEDFKNNLPKVEWTEA